MQTKATDPFASLESIKGHIAAGMWEQAAAEFFLFQSNVASDHPDLERVLRETESVLIFAKANREHLRSSLRNMAAGRQFHVNDSVR